METSKIEKLVLQVCKEQNWTLLPKDDLGRATEELGEVAREIRRYETGRERPDEIEPSKEVIRGSIADEIGDLLFAITKIASYYDITLEEAFMSHHKKLVKLYSLNNMEEI